ncbi:hypothetical protein K7711_36885 [Nocardia sp. CA2R105]|uniref:hypothetical protein n=1 Tax=Nocardia coffeae TaxID=2873381 RepID=UPI001CA74D02|nr:hypothetical protein [Nocardia coffeae]MBY8862099.1 hypothetical protein [Nocardia coffeae]
MELLMALIAVALGVPAVSMIVAYGSVAFSRQRRIQAVFRGVGDPRETIEVPDVAKVDLAM